MCGEGGGDCEAVGHAGFNGSGGGRGQEKKTPQSQLTSLPLPKQQIPTPNIKLNKRLLITNGNPYNSYHLHHYHN